MSVAPRKQGGGELGLLTTLSLAVTFLTAVPLPQTGEPSPRQLWRSMGWYPLVGLGLGLAGWAVLSGLTLVVPHMLAAVVVVAFLELATRGLHLDGLMDSADGLLSGAARERALEIMKDSRVGAMGVAAALFVALLKCAALASLPSLAPLAPLLVGWAAARTVPPLAVYLWPYARSQGTGAAFNQERSLGPVVAALVVLALVSIAGSAAGVMLDDAAVIWRSPLVAVAAVIVPLALLAGVARRLGGLTGDTYGLGIEVAETTALVVGCVLV